MCKRILLAGAIALSATAAHAETDYQRTHELAEQIGMLLASEQLCGLTDNQLAVQRFIEQHVDANDLQFPPLLELFVNWDRQQVLGSITGSHLTAHCTQIKRLATEYGLLERPQSNASPSPPPPPRSLSSPPPPHRSLSEQLFGTQH